MSKLASKLAGAALVFAGIVSLLYWGYRGFYPNAADRARIATIADYGGPAPADSRKIFLYGGVVAIAAGSAVFGNGVRR
jgi:hypothetical protein